MGTPQRTQGCREIQNFFLTASQQVLLPPLDAIHEERFGEAIDAFQGSEAPPEPFERHPEGEAMRAGSSLRGAGNTMPATCEFPHVVPTCGWQDAGNAEPDCQDTLDRHQLTDEESTPAPRKAARIQAIHGHRAGDPPSTPCRVGESPGQAFPKSTGTGHNARRLRKIVDLCHPHDVGSAKNHESPRSPATKGMED